MCNETYFTLESEKGTKWKSWNYAIWLSMTCMNDIEVEGFCEPSKRQIDVKRVAFSPRTPAMAISSYAISYVWQANQVNIVQMILCNDLHVMSLLRSWCWLLCCRLSVSGLFRLPRCCDSVLQVRLFGGIDLKNEKRMKFGELTALYDVSFLLSVYIYSRTYVHTVFNK